MAPIGPVTLTEVLIVLEGNLLDAAAPPPSQRYGKVFVGPIEATRGLSFDAVFVPGLAEKMFPRKIVEEPILLDTIREQIGGGLATNASRLEAERLALALAAGAADRQICFSYPRLDVDQARPRVPSFYALEVVRAAEGRLPDFAALTRRAESATTARLGWSAPADPSEAIDDAEYDLAILGRLTQRPERAPGQLAIWFHRQSLARSSAPGSLPALERILDIRGWVDEPLGGDPRNHGEAHAGSTQLFADRASELCPLPLSLLSPGDPRPCSARGA